MARCWDCPTRGRPMWTSPVRGRGRQFWVFMAGAGWGQLIRLDGMFGECRAASSKSGHLGPADWLGLPRDEIPARCGVWKGEVTDNLGSTTSPSTTGLGTRGGKEAVR